jgi:hypothetical protein
VVRQDNRERALELIVERHRLQHVEAASDPQRDIYYDRVGVERSDIRQGVRRGIGVTDDSSARRFHKLLQQVADRREVFD